MYKLPYTVGLINRSDKQINISSTITVFHKWSGQARYIAIDLHKFDHIAKQQAIYNLHWHSKYFKQYIIYLMWAG